MRTSRKTVLANSIPSKTSFVRNVSLKHVWGLMVIAVIFGVFAIPPAAGQGGPCTACPPESNWVAKCDSGHDQIEISGGLVGIDFNLDCTAEISLVLAPCSVLVVRRYPAVGDSMPTEIISMCLKSGDITLIAGYGHGHWLPGGLKHSYGAIVQLPDGWLAESFFDVYFEVGMPNPMHPSDTMYLYNQTPLRLVDTITCAPPYGRYIHVTECCSLYLSPIPQPGQQPVACVVKPEHWVNTPTLTEWGLIIFGVVLLGFITWVFLRRRKAAVSLR